MWEIFFNCWEEEVIVDFYEGKSCCLDRRETTAADGYRRMLEAENDLPSEPTAE